MSSISNCKNRTSSGLYNENFTLSEIVVESFTESDIALSEIMAPKE